MILQGCQAPNNLKLANKVIESSLPLDKSNQTNKLFSVKNTACSSNWSIRINNSDDDTYAYVNGTQVASIPYLGDSGTIDITPLLKIGTNTVTFETYNNCYSCGGRSPYSWGYTVSNSSGIFLYDSGNSSSYGPDFNTLSHQNSVNIEYCPVNTVDIPKPPNSCPSPTGFSTKAGIIPIIDFLISAYDLYVELDKLAKANPQVFDVVLAELKAAYNAAYDLVCSSDTKAQDQATKNLEKSIDKARKEINKNKTNLGSHPNGIYEASPKHGVKDTPFASRVPKDGQEALDNSILVKDISPTRIGISGKEIVVFQETTKGVYHGYVVPSNKLTTDQFNALYKADLINLKRKIL